MRARIGLVAVLLAVSLATTTTTAMAQDIRLVGVGSNDGNQAANLVFSTGDLSGTASRISHTTFNSMTVGELRAAYDVLLITWGTSTDLNADWATRILPFLQLGGGVLWEDPNNIGDLAPAVAGSTLNNNGNIVISATVPGLTDGIVGDPGGFVNYHTQLTSWTGFSPFMTAGAATIGLYGTFPGGGRMVITGPDSDYHATRPGNEYQFLVNKIAWVAPSCESDADCPAIGCLQAGVCQNRQCVHDPVPDGLACDDDNACTQVDQCVVGQCVGSDPVICTASDQCHVPGTCSPATGLCDDPVAPNGTLCDAGDGSACTAPDVCISGECRAGGGGDFDGDDICATDDICPNDFDPLQSDIDGDGVGDVCDLVDGGLTMNRLVIRRSRRQGVGGTNGRLIAKGDFLTSPGDVFTFSDGISVAISDKSNLDVSSQPLGWTSADCRTKKSGLVHCKSENGRLRARFKPLKGSPGIWRFDIRLYDVLVIPPFAAPMELLLTYGNLVDRQGFIVGCVPKEYGMLCTQPGSASRAFLVETQSLFD